jgi:hypothetical protein
MSRVNIPVISYLDAGLATIQNEWMLSKKGLLLDVQRITTYEKHWVTIP